MKRRDFLKRGLAGAGAAAGSTLLEGCGGEGPAYLEQEPRRSPGLPGVAVWTGSICQQCPAGCGIRVRIVDGDAKKIEGDPQHPVNRGGLCALGQSALQELYHPDRVTVPLKRRGEPGAGDFEEASWEEGLTAVAESLRASHGAGQAAILTAAGGGPLRLLWQRFAVAQGASLSVLEPLELEVERQAAKRVLGVDGLPVYDLGAADLVLSIGAPFLDTWRSPVHYARGFAALRGGRAGRRGRLVVAEPRLSLTGASADEWLPVLPGSEGLLARAVAGLLLDAGRVDAEREASYRSLFPSDPPSLEEASGGCGVDGRRIERLALELAAAERPLVIAGGSAAAHTNGLGGTAAGLALNLLLGRLGQEGGVFAPALLALEPAAPSAGTLPLERLARRLAGGEVELLLVSGADPYHRLPGGWELEAGLERTGTVVALSSFLDDTTAWADWVLPVATDLESFAAVAPTPTLGRPLLGLTEPVLDPRGQARHPGDVLLSLVSSLGEPWSTRLDASSFRDFSERLLGDARSRLPGQAPTARAFVAQALRRGGIWEGEADAPLAAYASAPPGPPDPIGLAQGLPDPALEAAAFEGSGEEYPWLLVPFSTTKLWDGRGANRPWLQELPETLSTVMWQSWAEVASADARRLGIVTGDLLRVSSPTASVEVAAVVSPAARPGCLGIPLGLGQRDYGRYARGRGVNPMRLVGGSLTVTGTTAPAWGATRVRVERVGRRASLPLYGRGLGQSERLARGWGAHRPEGGEGG